jgi:hypothetical protein
LVLSQVLCFHELTNSSAPGKTFEPLSEEEVTEI